MILFSFLASRSSSAVGLSAQAQSQPTLAFPSISDHPAPPVYATAAYLLDADTAETLFAKNAKEHLATYSTIKLMTALLAVEHGNLDQTVQISGKIQEDLGIWLTADSSLMGIKVGESYTLRELVSGLLLPSGNDAAIAIADAVAGSVPNFVALMNQRAAELGMHDTHYTNPHGLFYSTHYSSAHDLALLGKASLGNPVIREISGRRQVHLPQTSGHSSIDLLNGNQFLWWYPGVTGGKPGYDGERDFNQVIAVTRDGRHLIGVVLGTVDWWTDMRDLLNYGFNDYTWVSPREIDNPQHPIIYAALWNHFAHDTRDASIPMADGGRYYVYTGYGISGAIQSYFDAHGGLQSFGFPTSGAEITDKGSSQRFEHGIITCDPQQCHL